MTRQPDHGKRIALLATGDEITTGDILNTNARDIARRLADHHMQTGVQMAVGDYLEEIEHAIHHLLDTHDGLIITGGLGPTSDDLTRFALAKALDLPLVFEEAVWDAIVSRLRRYGHAHPPESNRQQALFPKNADIIQNSAGTAAGCASRYKGKPVFMLPGPPVECLPMIDNKVLPTLAADGFARPIQQKRWMLFGVSEGQIAETLDQIAFEGHCKTGYRLSYPYVEFKLFGDGEADFPAVKQALDQKLMPYLVGNGHQTASEWCLEQITQHHAAFTICDEATGGLLELTLKNPATCSQIRFTTPPAEVHVRGLDPFWQGLPATRAGLSLTIGTQETHIDAPFRDARVKQFAVEWVCRELGNWLQKMHSV